MMSKSGGWLLIIGMFAFGITVFGFGMAFEILKFMALWKWVMS